MKINIMRCALALCAALLFATGPVSPGAALSMAESATTTATDPLPVITRYPVGGNPLFVAVVSPSEVWFTLPAQNQVGRLTLSITDTAQVDLFPIPTLNAGAYAIAYGGGHVWFTETTAGKIGMVNTATGMVSEISTPPGSEPRRLAVLAHTGSPTDVWYADRRGNRLVDLRVTSPAIAASTPYTLTDVWAGAQLEGLALQTDRATHQDLQAVWFSAPGLHQIGRWTSGTGFGQQGITVGGQPMALVMDADNTLWFTEPQSARIGNYLATTLAITFWRSLPAGSGPFDLAIGAGRFFFTERNAGWLGWSAQNDGMPPRQRGVDGGDPAGIALDANGCAWVAQSGPGTLARWCSPYIVYTSKVSLPLLMKP